MAVTARFLPGTGQLTEFGDALDNTIITTRNAAGTILVNGGAVPVLGGTATVVRNNRANREAAAANQQAQAQQQAAYGNYEKAYATCLSGRGYSVK